MVSIGEVLSAISSSMCGPMPCGPNALRGFSFDINLLIPGSVMLISDMVQCLDAGKMFWGMGLSVVNTDSNCSFNIFAFSWLFTTVIPLFLSDATPVWSLHWLFWNPQKHFSPE